MRAYINEKTGRVILRNDTLALRMKLEGNDVIPKLEHGGRPPGSAWIVVFMPHGAIPEELEAFFSNAPLGSNDTMKLVSWLASHQSTINQLYARVLEERRLFVENFPLEDKPHLRRINK